MSKSVKKTKNVNVILTDNMQANFMVYFEKTYKKLEGLSPKMFSDIYSYIQDKKLYYLVPFEDLENSDMGWVIKKKESVFILEPHVIPLKENLPPEYDGIIMSKSYKDSHSWACLPQIPKALYVSMVAVTKCNHDHKQSKHIGNVSEAMIAVDVDAKDERALILKFLTSGKWITEKESDKISKDSGLIRINKNKDK